MPPLINKSLVERMDSFKYLGVHIPEGLTWALHTHAVVRQAWQRLFHYFTLEEIPDIISNTVECLLLHHQEHPNGEHHHLVRKLHRTGPQGPAKSGSFG